MAHQIQVIRLPGDQNFAVVGRKIILFGLGASVAELEQLKNEALTMITQENTEPQPASEIDQISEFALIPTYDCNQRCIYCYANAGVLTEVLPIEVAKAAIHSLKETENRKKLKLHLVGGGEPLLFKDWLFDLSAYIEQLFDEVEYHIVCN
jgi:sulfatase maturation enzyme AslB (radical SAM superfamily)